MFIAGARATTAQKKGRQPLRTTATARDHRALAFNQMAAHRQQSRLSTLASHLAPTALAPSATSSEPSELVLRSRGAVAPSEILFGCGPIVADRGGPIALEQIDDAIDAALKAGIVDFDTAPLYGDSEDRLGHALAASALGSQAQVYTKAGKLIRRICGNKQIALLGPQPWSAFGIPLEERCLLPDYSAAGARKSFTESCERMGGLSELHTLRIHVRPRAPPHLLLPTPLGPNPPLAALVKLTGRTVTVLLGTCTAGSGLDRRCVGSGNCSRWSYRWTAIAEGRGPHSECLPWDECERRPQGCHTGRGRPGDGAHILAAMQCTRAGLPAPR